MNAWTQVAYTYDGSFAGFLNCMDESFTHFEEPMMFLGPEEDRTSLYPERVVPTDRPRAKRFYRELRETLSKQVQTLVAHAFLACMPDRECAIWQFLKLARTVGPGVIYWITDERVNRLNKAVQHLYTEAHLLKGFTRFSDANGLLWSEIEPKNRVLPLLRPHFCQRFRDETFLIFDRTHHEALLYAQGKWGIRPVEDIQFPKDAAAEADYQRLWQKFYDTIAIEGRYNPKLRMSHVPKRYWQHMTELKGELEPKAEQAELPVEYRRVLEVRDG